MLLILKGTCVLGGGGRGGIVLHTTYRQLFFFLVCCSDLSGAESEVGPSQVKILDPTSSPIK